MKKLFLMHIFYPIWIIFVSAGDTCNVLQKQKRVRFQKRAARLILDEDFYTRSALLFSELNWMKFPERVIYQKAILMYKIFNDMCPEYLSDLFTLTSNIHDRALRSSSEFHLYSPKPRTEFFRKSFVCYGTHVWNGLPYHVKNAKHICSGLNLEIGFVFYFMVFSHLYTCI